MIKIKYPTNSQIRLDFENDYLSIFEISDYARVRYTAFRNFLPNPVIPVTLDKLLVLNFEDLSRCCFEQQLLNERHIKRWLKKFFDYKKYQSKIATFFMKNKKQVALSTCYYCNIDYINSFLDIGDYINGLDFVKRATKEDYQKIMGIGQKTADKIDQQKTTIVSVNDLNKVNKTLKHNINNFILNNEHNHFTLDHVLCQDDFPLAALCLYNFVPSCYSCNSKFKKSKHIVKDYDETYLSPTSMNFSVEDDIVIDLTFPLVQNWENVKSMADFLIDFSFKYTLSGYSNYIDVFKIKGRYVFHKNIALNLIEKAQKYPISQISEFSRLTTRSVETIKSDIFGSELFEGSCEEKPFSKFKREIARNIDL